MRLCKVDVEGKELAMLRNLKAHHRARIEGFAIFPPPPSLSTMR